MNRNLILILSVVLLCSCEKEETPETSQVLLESIGNYEYTVQGRLNSLIGPITNDYGVVFGTFSIEVQDERVFMYLRNNVVEFSLVEVGDNFYSFNLPEMNYEFYELPLDDPIVKNTLYIKHPSASQKSNGWYDGNTNEFQMAFELRFSIMSEFVHLKTI